MTTIIITTSIIVYLTGLVSFIRWLERNRYIIEVVPIFKYNAVLRDKSAKVAVSVHWHNVLTNIVRVFCFLFWFVGWPLLLIDELKARRRARRCATFYKLERKEKGRP